MSVRLDLHNLLSYTLSHSPVPGAGSDAAEVGNIIDRQGFHALEFVLQFGTIADTNATFVVLVEHGDDSGLSDNTAVPDTELLGTELLAAPLFSDDDTVKKIGYIGSKRFVRMTITPGGNTGTWPNGVLAVQSQRAA